MDLRPELMPPPLDPAKVARLADLGATSLSAPGDLPWLVFADPSGNEVCVLG